ncbi:hypothetical protein V6N13_033322 [Hibiscus sabdariffa]
MCSCFTIHGVTDVIIHGITLHDSKPGMAGLIRSSQAFVGKDRDNDSDVISIYSSSDVWIDHCSLSLVQWTDLIAEADGNFVRPQRRLCCRQSYGSYTSFQPVGKGTYRVNAKFLAPDDHGSSDPLYTMAQSFIVAPGDMVPDLTSDVGSLHCLVDRPCML